MTDAVKVLVQHRRRLTVAFSARHGSQKSMPGTSPTCSGAVRSSRSPG